jgi:hypothetical protein
MYWVSKMGRPQVTHKEPLFPYFTSKIPGATEHSEKEKWFTSGTNRSLKNSFHINWKLTSIQVGSSNSSTQDLLRSLTERMVLQGRQSSQSQLPPLVSALSMAPYLVPTQF